MAPVAQTQLKPFPAVLQHLYPEKGDGKTEAIFWTYPRGDGLFERFHNESLLRLIHFKGKLF